MVLVMGDFYEPSFVTALMLLVVTSAYADVSYDGYYIALVFNIGCVVPSATHSCMSATNATKNLPYGVDCLGGGRVLVHLDYRWTANRVLSCFIGPVHRTRCLYFQRKETGAGRKKPYRRINDRQRFHEITFLNASMSTLQFGNSTERASP